MIDYLARIWRLRYFWASLVRIDLRTRYRRSVLGIGWSLLHPILMTAVLCAVFCPMFKADYRQFAPFLLAGLAFWNFLTTTAMQGCHCFFQGESFIRQQAAPLAIYPLRTVLGTAIHGVAALVVVLAFTWVVRGLQQRSGHVESDPHAVIDPAARLVGGVVLRTDERRSFKTRSISWKSCFKFCSISRP